MQRIMFAWTEWHYGNDTNASRLKKTIAKKNTLPWKSWCNYLKQKNDGQTFQVLKRLVSTLGLRNSKRRSEVLQTTNWQYLLEEGTQNDGRAQFIWMNGKMAQRRQGTTLQSIMNNKLSKQRFWHCYENGLIKTIQTIPYITTYMWVSSWPIPLLWIILVYPKPQ